VQRKLMGFMHSCTTSWTSASFVSCLPLLGKLD